MNDIALTISESGGHVIIKGNLNNKTVLLICDILYTEAVSRYKVLERTHEVRIDWTYSELSTAKERSIVHDQLYTLYNDQPTKHGD